MSEASNTPSAPSSEAAVDLEKGGEAVHEPQPETPHEKSKPDSYLVKWDKDDPDNPYNWSSLRKTWVLALMSALAFAGSFGSSVMSPAQASLAVYLDIDIETSILPLSLFVLGFAFGPMLWGPLGECYGRRVSMLPAVLLSGVFAIGTAVSKNPESVFLTRFFGGLFASAPIASVAAAIGDLYTARSRGVPMALMALCVVGGPCIAPIVGAAVVVNPNLGWRWTEYIQAIITFFIVGLTFFGMPETYHPVLLKRKAVSLRKTTGDERYWHPHEEERIQLSNVFTKYVSRPLRMLVVEPMVTCMAVYASYVYGLLFFQLEAFPIVFGVERGMSTVVQTLPLLGLFIGVALALLVNFANQPFYAKAMARNGGRAVPEARLPPLMVGGVLFSVGLFWFGWTADPKYSWASPTIAGGFIGAGFNIAFQQCLNYLVDTYGPLAASALAGNTFLRSLLACALPLAARPLFSNLGVGPGSSLLGGLSCLALPVPLLFIKYGRQLRAKSKFAPAQEG